MAKMRDYLMDKAIRKNNMNRDYRDYYSSNRNDYRNDYRSDYREYDRRYDYGYDSRNRNSDYNFYPEYNRDVNRLAENNMLGPVKGMGGGQDNNYYPMYDRADYNYGNDFASDYNQEEKKYKKDLKEWEEKLKKKDRFGVSKEQIIKRAESMQIKFEDYDEEEFYVTYLMVMSDFPKVANDYNAYISMAKYWLEDDDIKDKGGDKLCKYYYTFVDQKQDERRY